MFIQDNDSDERNHEHKHYLIVIKKNKLKFYLSFNDSYSKRRKKCLSFESESMEPKDFKLDFKFGYYEKFYENLQQFHDDFKEVRADLIPSRDILNNKVSLTAYSLKWKLEDEETDDEEIVISEIKSVNRLQILDEHKKKIICIDYDRKKMATGSLDRLIFVYDIVDNFCIGKLEGHKAGVRCIHLVKNRLVSGSWDHSIIIWNLRNMCQVTTLYQHVDTVSSVFFDNDYLISGSYDKTINVWRFKETWREVEHQEGLQSDFCVVKHLRTIRHHKAMITSLTYDGIKTIVSSNADGSILLIDIGGRFIRELTFSKKPELITKIRLVGALILATTALGKVIFFNRKNNEVASIINGNQNSSPINSIQFYDDKFYTADNDCLIKEWELSTLTCLRHFESHNGPVLDLIVIDNKIVSCGADKVIVWNLKENRSVE